MRFCLLASGSKGNCVWIEAGGKALLVDAGLTHLELTRRAAKAGLDLARVQALIVTHEHSDHVRGVGPTTRKLGIPALATAGTAEAAGAAMTRLPELRVIAAGDVIDLGFLRLEALPGSHDAADPLVLAASEPGGARLGLATDLGTVTGLIRQAFRDLDALILEFNHDPEMLINGPYPLWLKQRVRGRTGHLSNEAAAEALAELNGPRLGRVVLAHLSEVNNTPKLALAAARGALPPEGGPEVRAAGQWVPTAVFDI